MEGAKIPPIDTRFKTEDVTSTKGMRFQDFKLSEDLQLVNLMVLLIILGCL